MSKGKSIRVLLLLLILAPLTFVAFAERDPRPGWDRPMVVGIYPYSADEDPAVLEWIERLSPADFRPIEAWLAGQAAAYQLEVDIPFELLLGRPLQNAPPPPPRQDKTWERLRWAAALRWWAWRFDDQGLGIDIIVVARFHGESTPYRQLQSIGMHSPRLALVKQIASELEQPRNKLILAHELLHTVGASDHYQPGSGRPRHPQGYVEPNREPRYPQPAGEVMSMAWPFAADIHIDLHELENARIGATTAREIGWR